jgi:hypothetical protein
MNPSTAALADLEVVTGSTLSAVGRRQVLRSSDGGASWDLLPAGIERRGAGVARCIERLRARALLARQRPTAAKRGALNGVSESGRSTKLFTDTSHGFILSDFKI